MDFSKLKNREKRRLFEFISHLAILAGREMSEKGYLNYNDVVMEFLDDVVLLDDFMAVAAKIKEVKRSYETGNC